MQTTDVYDDAIVNDRAGMEEGGYDRPTTTPPIASTPSHIADFQHFNDPSKSHDAPPRRPRTIILGLFMAVVALFHLIGLVTPVFKFHSGRGDTDVTITVKYFTIEVCPLESFNGVARSWMCDYSDLSDHLCTPVRSRIQAAGYFGIFSLLASIFIAIMCIVEYHGKVIVRSFTFRGACVVWVSSLVQWALLAGVFLEKLCKNTSLYQLNFKYHAGWALPFVAFLLLLIPIPLLFFLRKKLQGRSAAQP